MLGSQGPVIDLKVDTIAMKGKKLLPSPDEATCRLPPQRMQLSAVVLLLPKQRDAEKRRSTRKNLEGLVTFPTFGLNIPRPKIVTDPKTTTLIPPAFSVPAEETIRPNYSGVDQIDLRTEMTMALTRIRPDLLQQTSALVEVLCINLRTSPTLTDVAIKYPRLHDTEIHMMTDAKTRDCTSWRGSHILAPSMFELKHLTTTLPHLAVTTLANTINRSQPQLAHGIKRHQQDMD